MTIRNLFVIILKLIGFFFIIETLITSIPEQISLLINYDTIFPEEIRTQNSISFPIITITITFIILLFIYYIFIYNTEILIKFLKIEKYFKDKKIENLDIPIQKYTQISIIIISIILLIFQVPIFINLLTKYFGVIESFATELKINLISSTIIILISFIGIIFSDKLSKFFSK